MIGQQKQSSRHVEVPDSPVLGDKEEVIRQRAIKQIELRRHFRVQAVITAIGATILILIWAVTEYHNAGGWPTRGFSQSSGIHDVWNLWIVYPIGGLGLVLAGRAWFVYGNKPISDQEIEREIERQKNGS